MSSPQLPTAAIPKPLAEDDDDVSWALQTAGVQWGRGAYQDAVVWLRRAAESAIELNAWSRGADLNASAARLEKLVAQAMTGQVSSPSSIPMGAPSIRPSSPAPASPSFPAPRAGSIAPLPAYGRRVTSGYSSFPPKQSVPPTSPTSVSAPRNSVVIDDIEEAELELSDEEIRELEAETETRNSEIPDGYQRPSAFAGASQSLPAFALEPSRPLHERPSRSANPSALPSFPLEPSSRLPGVSTRPLISERPAEPEGLPSFPLETGVSSLPPVSKWPVHGRPGTSHIPPTPALPQFDVADSSRSFADDGDDGTVGLYEEFVRPTDSQRPVVNEQPAPLQRAVTSSIAELVSDEDLIEELDVQDAEEIAPVPVPAPRPKPSSMPRLPIRPSSGASGRPKFAATPIPPAMASGVPDAVVTKSSEPRLPSRSPLEPRLPARQPISSVPAERKLEILSSETRSVPPPSTRGIEPQDLPTVSSPSLSQPPAAAASRIPPRTQPSQAPIRSSRPSAADTEPDSVHPPTLASPSVALQAQAALSASVSPSSPPNELGEASQVEPLTVLPKVVSKSVAPEADEEPGAVLYGIRLSEVRGLSDLPAAALATLAKKARIESLNVGEEASFFSVALVLEGWVSLMPAIADAACATAVVGEVVYTEGTLGNGMMLRVVAGQDEVTVALWDSADITEATADCPWLADDLKLLADGFQALAGACLGPLGDRLDDSLRSIVTSRCEIRTLLPGEQLCAAKKPVPGMHIVGGGEVELVDENGRVMKTHGTGEFLFATQVLAGGGAPYSARAGQEGALVLFAPRMAAHELLLNVPPLLEILAE